MIELTVEIPEDQQLKILVRHKGQVVGTLVLDHGIQCRAVNQRSSTGNRIGYRQLAAMLDAGVFSTEEAA